MRSKLQKYKDLMNNYINLKVRIQQKNLETKIQVGDRTLSLAEAILLKQHGMGYMSDVLDAVVSSERNAKFNVDNYNQQLPNDSEDKNLAKEWYLLDQDELDPIHDFKNEFMENADSKIQIANATTELD